VNEQYIDSIMHGATIKESSCLCGTKLTLLRDTHELLVTRPKSFYTFLCSIHTNVYLHKNPFILLLYISVDSEFCGSACPQGFYHRCKFLCFQKKQFGAE